MIRPGELFARRRRVRLAVLGLAVCAAIDGASAADLLRGHRTGHRIGRLAIFPSDGVCPRDEPSSYKPRILNFREPLCYAARPYGLSQHLYDVSADILIDRGD